MRYCPKCGEKFEDIDIRSMCATCMVSLVPYPEPTASQVEMSRSGPVTVGSPISVPTIVVPEMRTPDAPAPTLPPEVPQIPHPNTPQPGPIRPPITPQPDPDYPQPTIIPDPETQPVPVPAPAPQPMPQPLPVPTPAEPMSGPPDLLSDAVTVKPAPAPAPPKEPTNAPASIVRRALTAEEQGTSRVAAGGQGFLGGICVLIALSILFNTDPENFGFFTLIFSGGLSTLGVFLFRQAIYHSAIQSVTIKPSSEPRLGAPLRLDLAIGVLRNLPIHGAEITIVGRERAVRKNGSNNSQDTSLHTFFSRTIPISTPGSWPANNLVSFHPQVTLPADAVSSFTGKNNHIEWTATLWVSIPGWFPDIRQKVALTIPAIRADRTLPEPTPHRYALPNLDDLHASLIFDCASTQENIPQLPAGRKIPFTLEMRPNEGGDNRKLWVELAYAITGSGDTERATVDRVACFRRGWHAGVPQQEQGLLTIPLAVPISYEGTHLDVQWSILVRMEIPWAVDRQQAFTVLVIPDEVP